MKGIRRRVIIAGVFFFIIGTLSYWFIPWGNPDLQKNVTTYISFLVTLFGFTVTVYQLRATEASILKSIQKPALQLEVLSPNDAPWKNPGDYSSQKTNTLLLYKIGEKKVGTRFAIRIQNIGKTAASRIWLSLLFKRRNQEEKNEIGKLDVAFVKETHNYRNHVIYYDYDNKLDWSATKRKAGITFKFSDEMIIYAHPLDRAVLAEIDVSMLTDDFEAEYELHYRILSYEGNSFLPETDGKKDGSSKNQIYPITFARASVSG